MKKGESNINPKSGSGFRRKKPATIFGDIKSLKPRPKADPDFQNTVSERNRDPRKKQISQSHHAKFIFLIWNFTVIIFGYI